MGSLCSECSGNVHNVADLKECKLAMSNLKTGSKVKEGSWNYTPKGCYTNGVNFYWNTHLTGKIHQAVQSVCKSTDQNVCGK